MSRDTNMLALLALVDAASEVAHAWERARFQYGAPYEALDRLVQCVRDFDNSIPTVPEQG